MKRTIKHCGIHIILLAMALGMLFGMMSVSASSDASIEAKNGVVSVIDCNGISQGSGFAIGKKGQPVQYFVTNNHVVNPIEGQNNPTAIILYSSATGDSEEAEVVLHDSTRDIAVLRLSRPTDRRKPLVLCRSRDMKITEECAALGYPYNQASDWARIDLDSITITRGYISREDRTNGVKVYRLDLTITHGNSGGPIVNSRGEVIGIAAFGLVTSGSEGVVDISNYAIMTDELIRMIEPYSDEIIYSEHSSVNFILIIIGAVLLCAVAALLIVLLTLKKKNAAVPEVASAGQNVAAPVQAAGAAGAQPASSNQRVGAKIVAIGGVMNGKKYSVRGVVKVGRDASQCGIAFPVSAQGVGRVHCEIGFDGAVCYIRDLSSSYGTFLADGTKLPANQAKVLTSGDKFYLATPENMFEVQL